MRQTLRTLERVLVRERAELHARAVMDKFLPRWSEAVAGGLYADFELEFARQLGACGLHLTVPHAVEYLVRCRTDGSEPDPARLLRILLP